VEVCVAGRFLASYAPPEMISEVLCRTAKGSVIRHYRLLFGLLDECIMKSVMPREAATYLEIQQWVRERHGFTPQTCWIAHCKEITGCRLSQPRTARGRNARGVPTSHAKHYRGRFDLTRYRKPPLVLAALPQAVERNAACLNGRTARSE
jgi:hypothetical protein